MESVSNHSADSSCLMCIGDKDKSLIDGNTVWFWEETTGAYVCFVFELTFISALGLCSCLMPTLV